MTTLRAAPGRPPMVDVDAAVLAAGDAWRRDRDEWQAAAYAAYDRIGRETRQDDRTGDETGGLV